MNQHHTRYSEALADWHKKRIAMRDAQSAADAAWRELKAAADNLHINDLRAIDAAYYAEHPEDKSCLRRW